ncbi:MAG: hypothetical protein PHE17_20570 [Thiothrix sp.]|uniref:hypothetical protein n=1 Tax=Thiothrix sp. TaxID=1032 RepID=UPI0026235F57|nr:hypothetical protein [Thiothrix sp.]MDD5395425.1 hypothetical protein [Thiothrix sp.]
MGTWFTKNLGDATLAHPALEQLQGLFRETYGLDGYANDTAIFTRHESEGRLHCEVKAYFSPAAISIANAVGAAPCRKPIPTDLGLLMGSDAAWPALFPEHIT